MTAGRIDEWVAWARREKLRKMLAEIREWVRELNRRDPIVFYRVFVKNAVTREEWYWDFDTHEEVERYLQHLAHAPGFATYEIREVLPLIYEIGPWRVNVVPVRKSMARGWL